MVYFFTKSQPDTSISKYSVSNKNKKSSKNQFNFSVEDLNKSEVAKLNRNSSVNFWQKPNSNTVFIYRAGTIGGQGRIGVVPNKYSKQIINDLQNKRPHRGKISSVSNSNVIIRYKRLSSQKIKDRNQKYAERRSNKLEKLLSKNYSPQKGFETSISLEKETDFTVGESLNIRFEEKESYVNNPQKLEIEFYNSENEKVGFKRNNPDKIRRILRAHFNDYEILVELSSVHELDETTLKYYDQIPGTVRIDFHKNA